MYKSKLKTKNHKKAQDKYNDRLLDNEPFYDDNYNEIVKGILSGGLGSSKPY